MKSIDFLSEFPLALRWVYPIIAKALGVDNLNGLLEELTHARGHLFVTEALRKLNIHTDVLYHDYSSIPREGGVIFVANHPTGMVEGLLGLSIIHALRPDIKVVGHRILSKFIGMLDFLIPVERPSRCKISLLGVRHLISHLNDGKALLIFPSGLVSSYKWGCGSVEHRWHPTVARLIMRYQIQTIPVRFGGRNSLFFYLMQSVSPSLSSKLLIRELINKKNSRIPMSIGKSIPYQSIQHFEDAEKLIEHLHITTCNLTMPYPDCD